jgi:hypothetical protein
MTEQALTREWYTELEKVASNNFINLPIEFQIRGYDYDFLSRHYLSFFRSDSPRQDKLTLAKKFLKFIRTINKNRAKHELGPEFFECFEYFMNNFSDLIAKQDLIHLDTLSIISEAIDKSQFIEDIISVDDLKRRVDNLKNMKEKEDAIDAEWSSFETEYKNLQIVQKVPATKSFF